MRTPLLSIAVAVLALSGCSTKGPTAKEVGAKLEAAGFMKNCRESKPDMLAARAAERFDCDLVAVPGQGAAVMSFADDDAYSATVKAYETAAMLSGPHRYGNPKARIFVQANRELSLEDGKKLRAFVEGL